MENEIIKLASSQGIWAALSIILIFYTLKTQEKRDIKQEEREKKFQEIISNLSDKFSIIEDVRNDVSEMKEYLYKINNKNNFL